MKVLLGGSLARRLFHASSGLVADDLSRHFVPSNVDRQATELIPCIQVRSVDHEQLYCFQMTSQSSKMKRSRTVPIRFVPVEPLL